MNDLVGETPGMFCMLQACCLRGYQISTAPLLSGWDNEADVAEQQTVVCERHPYWAAALAWTRASSGRVDVKVAVGPCAGTGDGGRPTVPDHRAGENGGGRWRKLLLFVEGWWNLMAGMIERSVLRMR